MGSYTALYGNIGLKPEFNDFVQSTICEHSGVAYMCFNWDLLKRHRGVKNHPDFKNLIKKEGYKSIGARSSIYFDDCDVSHLLTLRNEDGGVPVGISYARQYGLVNINSDFKNYDDEINAFINLLPVIADWWELENILDATRNEYEPDNHRSVLLNGRVYNETTVGGRIDDEPPGYSMVSGYGKGI